LVYNQNNMATTKKRPSKNAKAALKILEQSKLLATAKPATDAKTDAVVKPTENSVKTATPKLMRPNKKRG
jgi:hypothetical protein